MTGKQIKKLRESLGMTQNEFAARVGVNSFVIISRWENEKSKPRKVYIRIMEEMKNV